MGRPSYYAGGEGPPGPENRTAFSDLWTVSVDGGEPRRLFAGDAVQPRVSPNGSRIAYWNIPSDPTKRAFASADQSNREIWTIDRDGNHPLKVAGHEANDWNPVRSPDGQWLYFLSNRSGSMGLWRVAIDEIDHAAAAPDLKVADRPLERSRRHGRFVGKVRRPAAIQRANEKRDVVRAAEAIRRHPRHLEGPDSLRMSQVFAPLQDVSPGGAGQKEIYG